VRGKQLVVSSHEPRLADGGTGLFLREFRRTRLITERTHAGTDCATGDDDDFLAGFFERGDLRDDLLKLRGVDQFTAVGQDTGAELDDDAGNGLERVAMHAGKLGEKQFGVEPPSRNRI